MSKRQKAIKETKVQAEEASKVESKVTSLSSKHEKAPEVTIRESALKPARDEAAFDRLTANLETEGLRKRKVGEFGADISEMMFGFGDSWPPNTDAVRCIDTMVTEFIQDMGARALRVAELRPDKRLDKECFLYLVRKDRKKFQRVHRLLAANEEIKRVKKVDIKEETK
jgi:hypothetical protein